MTRMTARPSVTAAATATAAVFLLLPWAAGSAQAHGAPTAPVSRVYACSPEGGDATRSAACRAAVAANGAPFTAWDNLRVAGVNGRDRQLIPDGRLCSGNLPAYRGLDLARRDWPATRLAPGGRLTMTYASTIAHTGTFRLYLTKPGYDPSKPLTWSDLPERPFARVTDPPLRDGAYHIGATLPTDRTGRQVLYTVWQNSSTPDTYYSCSDVVFPERAQAAGTAPAAGTAQAKAPQPTAANPAPAANEGAGQGKGPSAHMLTGGAAAVLVLTGGAALAVRLRRR
ncbi:lytic polysaccharide monooxygenase [Streptomyces sp. NPDC048191]|uniref:lytic polysaccharide monooxygenase auxiliary activity family 9 protein n=1 Tax=Streptomyces sp. NPDC048191 TaxID=3155484 RepID=UPI0033ED9277